MPGPDCPGSSAAIRVRHPLLLVLGEAKRPSDPCARSSSLNRAVARAAPVDGKIRVCPVSERTPAKARIRLFRRPTSRSSERQRNGRRLLTSGVGVGVTDALATETAMAEQLAVSLHESPSQERLGGDEGSGLIPDTVLPPE